MLIYVIPSPKDYTVLMPHQSILLREETECPTKAHPQKVQRNAFKWKWIYGLPHKVKPSQIFHGKKRLPFILLS